MHFFDDVEDCGDRDEKSSTQNEERSHPRERCIPFYPYSEGNDHHAHRNGGERDSGYFQPLGSWNFCTKSADLAIDIEERRPSAC